MPHNAKQSVTGRLYPSYYWRIKCLSYSLYFIIRLYYIMYTIDAPRFLMNERVMIVERGNEG